MLIVSDSRRGGVRVVVVSVLFSVCASVVATLLLHDALEEGAQGHARRAPPAPRVVLVDGADERPPPPPAEAIARLETELARLKEAVGAGGAGTAGEVAAGIGPLLAIEQGERQMAIRDEVERLVVAGDAAVPEIVGALKAGHDRDWGGGFSFGGNMFRGYPRLRTALIDVLRQIGTPEAKRGLLDVLAEGASVTDYRDLLLAYGTTDDRMMIDGIATMMPAILLAIREPGADEHGQVERSLAHWVRRHDVSLPNELLAETSLQTLRAGSGARGELFPLLLERDPERAGAVLAELSKDDDDRAALRSALFGARLHEVPRARLARFCEAVLVRMAPDASARATLYSSLPTTPCPAIEDPGARAEDLRALLELLRGRLALEQDRLARSRLENAVRQIEQGAG